MSGLPPGFQLDTPPAKPKSRVPRLDGYTPSDDTPTTAPPILPGTSLQATGKVVDGDTMRLSSGVNSLTLTA